MLVLISPAKTFSKPNKNACPVELTTPPFLEESRPILREMLRLPVDTLAKELSLSPKLAQEAYAHWQNFIDDNRTARSVLSLYSGMVYKKIELSTFSTSDWSYAQDHLLITSFLYGLLRPLDAIHSYRLEGAVELNLGKPQSVFEYWRQHLTTYFIERIQEQGGTLIYLASEEMKQLFDWKRVRESVRVISPTFLVDRPNGTRKQIVIYTKMARGLMTGAILRGRLTDPEILKTLTPEGFVYSSELSTEEEWVYLLCQ